MKLGYALKTPALFGMRIPDKSIPYFCISIQGDRLSGSELPPASHSRYLHRCVEGLWDYMAKNMVQRAERAIAGLIESH
jgi:hypothetical protein